MRQDINRQWIGAMFAEDVELIGEMLKEDPGLGNSTHEAFDDPFRARRLPVASLLFAVAGPPQQTVRWHQVKRRIDGRIVDLLLEHGADANIYSRHGRPLCWARERGIAKKLIDSTRFLVLDSSVITL